MNLLVLAFAVCGSLTLVTKAGWETIRCWKDDIGYCRKRCLKGERYKLLCENKLICCIPRILPQEPTPRLPAREIDVEDITVEADTVLYPEVTMNDYFTIQLSYQRRLSEANGNDVYRDYYF